MNKTASKQAVATGKAAVQVLERESGLVRYSVSTLPYSCIYMKRSDIDEHGLAIALDLFIDQAEAAGYWGNWNVAQHVRKALGL